MDYFICNFPDGSHTVTKCDGSTVIAQYTVKDYKCDCIAGSTRGKCKHTLMVEKWKPGCYIEQTSKGGFSVLPLSQELISK